MGYRAGHGQQQSGGCRKGCRETAGGHEGDNYRRQAGHLRGGEDDDISVDYNFVVGIFFREYRQDSVAVLIFIFQKTGFVPFLNPYNALDFFHRLVSYLVEDVVPGENGNSRSGGIQQGDEQERPAGGITGRADGGSGVEAYNNMGQSGGADHQGHGNGKYVTH